MRDTPNGSNLNTFLGITGVILSFASLYATANGDALDPYLSTAFAAIGVVGAFMAGLNASAAKDRLNTLVDERLGKAASKAVEAKMPEVEEAIDRRFAQLDKETDEKIIGVFSEENGTLNISTSHLGKQADGKREDIHVS